MSDSRSAPDEVRAREVVVDVSAASGPRVVIDVALGSRDLVDALRDARTRAPGALIALLVGSRSGSGDLEAQRAVGSAAARIADIVIVSDLPSREADRAAVRSGLLDGARAARPRVKPIEVVDPAVAIRLALQLAGEVGCVYWGGPGAAIHRDPRSAQPGYSAVDDARRALAELDP